MSVGMIKAIIFDLDGTLCNTIEDIRTGVNAMLTKLGYKTRTRADIIKFINNGARSLVTRSLPKDVQGVEFIVDTALDVYSYEYSKCYSEFTEAYNGVEYMLNELKKQGYKLAVISNKQDRFVKDICEKLFGKKMFNFVMGNTEGVPTKPDPTSTLYVAKLLGAKPNACVYIGDSDVDVKTAKNAGMDIIGCDWGYRGEEVLRSAGAERIARKPEDIVEHIKLIEMELEKEKEEKRLAKRRKKPSPKINEQDESENEKEDESSDNDESIKEGGQTSEQASKKE